MPNRLLSVQRAARKATIPWKRNPNKTVKTKIFVTSDDNPEEYYNGSKDAFISYVYNRFTRFFETKQIAEEDIIFYFRDRKPDMLLQNELKKRFPKAKCLYFAADWTKNKEAAGLERNKEIFKNELSYVFIYLNSSHVNNKTGIPHIMYLANQNRVQIKFLKGRTSTDFNNNVGFEETPEDSGLPEKNSTEYNRRLQETIMNQVMTLERTTAKLNNRRPSIKSMTSIEELQMKNQKNAGGGRFRISSGHEAEKKIRQMRRNKSSLNSNNTPDSSNKQQRGRKKKRQQAAKSNATKQTTIVDADLLESFADLAIESPTTPATKDKETFEEYQVINF
jgi:hypothetical protein